MQLIPPAFIATVAATAAGMLHAPARACECDLATPHSAARFVTPGDALLPLNARGVVWWAGEDAHIEPPDVVVTRVDADRERRVPFALEPLEPGLTLIAPADVFRSGASCRFKQRLSPHVWQSIDVAIDSRPLVAAPASADLIVGDAVSGLLQVSDASSCSSTYRVSERTVSMPLTGPTATWRDALLFHTTVDDRPWRPSHSMCPAEPPPGTSWMGPGRERVFAVCQTPAAGAGLGAGVHRVRMRASLPGTPLELQASADVDLRCGTQLGISDPNGNHRCQVPGKSDFPGAPGLVRKKQ